jgi:hypothetical protein
MQDNIAISPPSPSSPVLHLSLHNRLMVRVQGGDDEMGELFAGGGVKNHGKGRGATMMTTIVARG